MYDAFFAFLAKEDVEYKRNATISLCSSVKIGGNADVAIFPNTQDKLIRSVKYLKENKIKYRVVGKMSNILADDSGYCGVLVFTTHLNRFSRSDCYVNVECGALFSHVIARCAKYGLGGAEALFGIPGTVGGMVFSNAGAFGSEISDFLVDALVYDSEKEKIQALTATQMQFSYRSSILNGSRLILLSATFLFERRRQEDILNEVGKIKERRMREQPYEYPSLGSIFKRVDGISAGKLIDMAGMKGYSVGGAQISQKHAGFIINKHNSSSEDFKKIISDVKQTVSERYGVLLNEEIEYL